MTTTAEVIVNDVSELLQDVNKDRWSDDTLIRWINEAQLIIAANKPDAVAAVDGISLAPGVEQVAPAGSVMILRIRRNTVSGAITRLVDEDEMNSIDPSWPSAAPASDVSSYIYDPKLSPLTFMVSPPNDGSGNLRILYAKIPPVITDTTEELAVSDAFNPSVKDYVMYRALQMETEGQNLQRSMQHFQAFAVVLGLNTEALSVSDPNQEVEANG